jgi:ubiquinone/menaquinone biosynthesis C-methylase UbiE
MTVAEIPSQTSLAFDSVAEQYDDQFTRSVVGRTQRDAVWRKVTATFSPGQHILELNCGTGEDALFLARNGISVTALDASRKMVLQARRRHELEAPCSPIRFELVPTEQLRNLNDAPLFDGVFSNFSGLNCVEDLTIVAEELAHRVKPGGSLLFCLSTRVCLWEIFWYLLHGNFRKAFRRCGGHATARFNDYTIHVRYPTLRRLRALFAPFALRSCTGIGIMVPPSYLEPWARKHPKLIGILSQIDRALCNLPIFRVIGDHMLLHLEKIEEESR